MELVLASASQIATYRDCPRKWAFDKLDKIPRPDTNATNLGKAIHTEIENYYKDGTVPASKAAQAILTHLPAPGKGVVPENNFQFTWPGLNVLVRGSVDLVDTNTNTIYDHKTTSNVARYSKTEEELAKDPQSIIYGFAYRQIIQTGVLNLQWTYVESKELVTRPPHTKPVIIKQDLTDLQKGMNIMHPILEAMQEHTQKKRRALDIVYDREACYKFGKCPYSTICPDYASIAKPEKEFVPMNFDFLKNLTIPVIESAPATPQVVIAPQHTEEPPEQKVVDLKIPKMSILDTLAIDTTVAPSVLPPDAQPNISPSDPPVPGVKPAKAPKVAKERKPRGKKVEQVELEALIAEIDAPKYEDTEEARKLHRVANEGLNSEVLLERLMAAALLVELKKLGK